MRIRAVSVFEGVVYHCWPVDLSNPERIQLEVDALLRPGDADATTGPLLLSVADYIAMVGDLEVARTTLLDLAANGRIVQHLTADHIAFPTWTRVTDDDDRNGEADPIRSTSGFGGSEGIPAPSGAFDLPTGAPTGVSDESVVDPGRARPTLRLVVDSSDRRPDL